MKKLVLPLLFASLFASANVSAKMLTLGHAMSLDSAAHQGMVIMAEKVKEKSNGDLTIKIFPNGQLGSERDQAEQVVTGAIDMAKINGGLAESFEPTFKVNALPFLFRDVEHMRTFMRSDAAEEMLVVSEGKGFIGLTFYDSGTRSFYAKKPINSPADLAGMKVRVPGSPTMMEMVNLLGGKATPVPFNEVYTALQQGVIDGAENNISSLVEMKHSEVAKFYSMDQHMMTPDVIIISENKWNSLSADEQKILKEAAAESLEEQIRIWDETDNMNKEKGMKEGVTFVEVDKAPFRAAVKPMIDEAKQDPKLATFIDKIEAL
jgi:tripartite ATP-independent transporter DctP family solute receptor